LLGRACGTRRRGISRRMSIGRRQQRCVRDLEGGAPSPPSPHISQFSPPLRSLILNSAVEAPGPRSRERERVDAASTAEFRLICTRHICWRWSQDMRARFKTAPPKRDHATKQTEKRLPAQERLTILLGALRSVLGAVLPIARMCRPADSARGYSIDCMQATEWSAKHPG